MKFNFEVNMEANTQTGGLNRSVKCQTLQGLVNNLAVFRSNANRNRPHQNAYNNGYGLHRDASESPQERGCSSPYLKQSAHSLYSNYT